MAQWHYVDKNQQRVGPMEASVLVDALRHGQLTTSSMVWQEGMPAWQPLSMHFDSLGVPESLRVRKKEKSGCATWAIVLAVFAAISVPVLGIMIAISIPAYQDYTIRAKVSEGLNLAATTKFAVAETRLSTEKWPNNDAEAGLTAPVSNIYAEVTIPAAQDIQITFSPSIPEIAGKTLMLRGDIREDGVVIWECNAQGSNKLNGPSGTLPAKYAPTICRP